MVCTSALAFVACHPGSEPSGHSAEGPASKTIEIDAFDYAHRLPDTVGSGGNLYRLRNRSGEEVHEVVVVRLPEGRELGEYLDDFVEPWQEVLDELHAGSLESVDAAVVEADRRMAEWTEEIEYIRSRGLTSPGGATEFALRLEPGTYVFECWLKAPDGRLHTLHGMHQLVEVVEADAPWQPSEPDQRVTVSAGGLESEGDLNVGRQLVEVTFADGAPHTDLHLVRIEEEGDLPGVVRWMDWYAPDGLRGAPPVPLLGGLRDYRADAGEVGYVGVNPSEPGLYAWVALGLDDEAFWELLRVR